MGNVGIIDFFRNINGEVMLFTIQEYGLLETFLDYLQNMLESSFYTSEEAAAYVEKYYIPIGKWRTFLTIKKPYTQVNP
mgnify:CR=1 FL=1